MVVEPPRICGRVGFVLGVTGYLGRAWWDLELHGCYCMGACITGLVGVTRNNKVLDVKPLVSFIIKIMQIV